MNFSERIRLLREEKLRETKEKLKKMGPRDEDDYGSSVPVMDLSASLPCRDPDGSFHGAFAWGRNFRYVMEHQEAVVDPRNAIAGRWMYMLGRMRKGYKLELSNFPFDYSHLKNDHLKYDITCGIGKDAHFAPDYAIGLKNGWNGLLKKVDSSLERFHADKDARELLEAEQDAIRGIQCWIGRLADEAERLMRKENDRELRKNLEEIAGINRKLIYEPPSTFRECCQFIAHFNMASRTYNRDGAGGQLDELLRPYYERDTAEGRLTDEEAVFDLFCLLLNDPHYYQIGGPGPDGRDLTSRLSYLILDAAETLNSSCNLTIRVHDGMDANLLERGMGILLAKKNGFPRFSGDKALVEGFQKNGYSVELARQRVATGCNWMSLPGLEYTLNDVVKINLAKVFEVSFQETASSGNHSMEALERCFTAHWEKAVSVTAEGIDFHMKYQFQNEPELLLNLLSHGPVEKGLDVSHGGAVYYNMALDCAGLATVADSFSALQQKIFDEKILTWEAVDEALKSNFKNPGGPAVRAVLMNSDRFGAGGGRGDFWAARLTEILRRLVANRRTPDGFLLIPGWFSWADDIRFGSHVGATPNGRPAYAPISHGANPDPGFRKDCALSAMSDAVASVQPGFGNTAPWQLDVDLDFANHARSLSYCCALIRDHFRKGGTLININIVDAEKILQAHKNPDASPELVVRVTGFSAYFSALSANFRKLVVDRVLKMK